MKSINKHAIILFAHGARDPEWARPFEQIRERVRASRPEYPIELAYLELMSPTLEEAIQSVVREGALAVTVFPLFMAQGGHLKQDLPRILDAVRAYATVGEMCDALRDVWGEYEEVPII